MMEKNRRRFIKRSYEDKWCKVFREEVKKEKICIEDKAREAGNVNRLDRSIDWGFKPRI